MTETAALLRLKLVTEMFNGSLEIMCDNYCEGTEMYTMSQSNKLEYIEIFLLQIVQKIDRKDIPAYLYWKAVCYPDFLPRLGLTGTCK